MRLTVATTQFPVSDDIARNCDYVLRQMRTAKKSGADVAHFCEAGLSGYADPGVVELIATLIGGICPLDVCLFVTLDSAVRSTLGRDKTMISRKLRS